MEIGGSGPPTGPIVDNQIGLPEMILKLSMLVSCAAFTMTAQEIVQPNLEGLKYPALAKSASIQGIIQFVVNSDGIRLVSGHPMLVAAAKSNLEKWAQTHVSDIPLSVSYSFRLADPKFIEVDEPILDKFDRFFLRLFHLPVTRRVKEYRCVHPEDYPPVFRSEVKDGHPSIEISVEEWNLCVNAMSSR
jgi:hypothetical protein